MSDDLTWKKDEKPYLVFRCAKCKQYLYVKKTQKTKKCLRCGHRHEVSKILDPEDTAYGLSNVIELVKKKQHELALKIMGNSPEFRGLQDFKVVRRQKIKTYQRKSVSTDNGDDLTNKFKEMLNEISETYKEFPDYVIEIVAENYGIPNSELKMLTRYFLKEGFLIRLENYLYTMNS